MGPQSGKDIRAVKGILHEESPYSEGPEGQASFAFIMYTNRLETQQLLVW